MALIVLGTAPAASADTVRAGQWYLSALKVTKAWQTTRGAGVTVCVIDSGIDAHVPDLRGAVKARKQFTKYVDDNGLVTSHGTGVASVLAGRGHGPNHADGVIGVAPAASLLDAVVGEADANIDQQVADALHWCTDTGAKVINMSLALLSNGPMQAATAYAESKDVVLVAATGNTFEHLSDRVLPHPAGFPGVVAVTGIDKNLKHDAGAVSSAVGKPVSLAAPFSTTSGVNGYPDVGLPIAGVPARDNGRPYALHAAGTSFASPIVAGTAALIRAAHPRMSANDVIAALLATATPAGSGHPNRTYGWGILDVSAAVAARLPHVSENPVVTGKVPKPPRAAVRAPSAASASSASSAAAGTGTPTSARAAKTPAAAAPAGSHSSATLGWSVLAAALVIAGGGAAAFAWRRRATS